MCDEAIEDKPEALEFVPDCYKTQKMCEKAVEKDPWSLKYVPDDLKT